MATIFIGDLHGCAAEFESLLQAVDYRVGRDRLLLTGDAFSRGPNPRRVWELIVETRAEMVLGNHDARLLQQLQSYTTGEKVSFEKPDQRLCFDALSGYFDELYPWLQRVPLKIEGESFLLVHAGVHPIEGVAGTSRDEFLNVRTWPPTGGIDGPRWHDVIAPTDRTIIFGHDAPGGLVIKRRAEDEVAWAMGLDSGCIYGGELTAYVQDSDRIVQVPSQQDGDRRWR
ncbi:MAG: hypothetical protein HOM68_15540 [Gemmatimonadetes bacterium]|nr:hypothetical protein [Gemmatimonadota bacterium]MBT5057956.1 hypothetical protein [Gemmatimonadota bacterium]MBT5144496.1 hypothetical protein [Gemmatimonadota bacterium]MBT5587952.1 hypothetical protein [Gemmatimonadota bacterium]MBT5960255.1 hypothetical protein [Gemmatimonadota bacterium]